MFIEENLVDKDWAEARDRARTYLLTTMAEPHSDNTEDETEATKTEAPPEPPPKETARKPIRKEKSLPADRLDPGLPPPMAFAAKK